VTEGGVGMVKGGVSEWGREKRRLGDRGRGWNG